jgi:hypothetical protein
MTGEDALAANTAAIRHIRDRAKVDLKVEANVAVFRVESA